MNSVPASWHSAESFGAAYDQHAGEVLRAAYAILRDRDLAEDVCQDVFARLWQKGDFDPDRGALGGYLRMRARSRALDVWRSLRARQRLEAGLRDAAAAATPSADDPVAALMDVASRDAARDAVGRLPPEQREAVLLAYWRDLTTQETAAAAGIPLGTAKSRLRLAFVRLRRDAALTAA